MHPHTEHGRISPCRREVGPHDIRVSLYGCDLDMVTLSVSCNVFNVAELIDEYVRWQMVQQQPPQHYCMFGRVNILQWMNAFGFMKMLLLIVLNFAIYLSGK